MHAAFHKTTVIARKCWDILEAPDTEPTFFAQVNFKYLIKFNRKWLKIQPLIDKLKKVNANEDKLRAIERLFQLCVHHAMTANQIVCVYRFRASYANIIDFFPHLKRKMRLLEAINTVFPTALL